MFFKKLCVLELWTKVASALEGLIAMSKNIFSQGVKRLIKQMADREIMFHLEIISFVLLIVVH